MYRPELPLLQAFLTYSSVSIPIIEVLRSIVWQIWPIKTEVRSGNPWINVPLTYSTADNPAQAIGGPVTVKNKDKLSRSGLIKELKALHKASINLEDRIKGLLTAVKDMSESDKEWIGVF